MQISITTLLPWIPALPLVAAIVTAILGPKILRNQSHWPTIIALVLATIGSLCLLGMVGRQQRADGGEAGFEQIVLLWTWAEIDQAYDASHALGQDNDGAQRASRPFRVDVALRADSLTAMMLAMVTFISTLVAVFSVGYMRGDRGYSRFFTFMALFVFSMSMLVSVSNFVLLFVFWEAVGLCSYLLIGFWYTKPSAAAAGKKAFLVNRVGDFGFTLALFLIWVTYGTMDYHDTPVTPQHGLVWSSVAPQGEVASGVLGKTRIATGDYIRGSHGHQILLAICLLLLVGACGKSAQFPLHVWLPDAMEGPTPVSALIHAATMVTAGVYMIARCSPLFVASPDAQLVVALVGAATALMAACIATTQFDLKRVLAYSTISQLGYMFLGLGVGTLAGVTASMFHLFTHAFFKALLFLGAGSVMHAMGNVIDMRRFGGLRKIMPITHWTFLVGCLALAGIPPFSGFWSKDSIVAAVHDRAHEYQHAESLGHDPDQQHFPATAASASRGQVDEVARGHDQQGSPTTADAHVASVFGLSPARRGVIFQTLYYVALVTALMTAFYTFRAFFMTFYGPLQVPHEAGHHAHESPTSMCGPLLMLSVFAALVGLALDWTAWSAAGSGHHGFARFIEKTPSLAAGEIATTASLDRFHPTVALVSSLVAALGLSAAALIFYRRETSVRRPAGVEIRRIPVLSRFSPRELAYRKFYIDEIYGVCIVRPLTVLAGWLSIVDRGVIDRSVDFVGHLPKALGRVMRSLQMGLIQFYALAMILVVVVVLATSIIWAAS